MKKLFKGLSFLFAMSLLTSIVSSIMYSCQQSSGVFTDERETDQIMSNRFLSFCTEKPLHYEFTKSLILL